jgi:hypothetical protein
MTHGRSTRHGLADDRVLVAGGYFNGLPIALADLYSPATDTFAVTGPMSAARGFGTATLLGSGRVLFAGGDPMGWDYNGGYLASAELYDATTRTFGPTARWLRPATSTLRPCSSTAAS